MITRTATAGIELALGIVGAVLLVYGISQWTRPGACIAAGLLLIAVAVWPSAAKPRGPR